MKKILFCFLLSFLNIQVYSQISVRALYFNPTGDQGRLFEKKITGEIMYLQELDDYEDNWRMRMGFSYIPLQSRLDTFPSYAEGSNGTFSGVFPGYEIYQKYTMQYLFMGFDYAVLNRDAFGLYFGSDILIGAVNMEYEAHYATIFDDGYSGFLMQAGLRFRGGGQYNFNDHFVVTCELNRAYYIIDENGFQSHFDYGLGVQYIF